MLSYQLPILFLSLGMTTALDLGCVTACNQYNSAIDGVGNPSESAIMTICDSASSNMYECSGCNGLAGSAITGLNRWVNTCTTYSKSGAAAGEACWNNPTDPSVCTVLTTSTPTDGES